MFTVPMLNPRPNAIEIHLIAERTCFERPSGNHSAIGLPTTGHQVVLYRLSPAPADPRTAGALTSAVADTARARQRAHGSGPDTPDDLIRFAERTLPPPHRRPRCAQLVGNSGIRVARA
ncbi:hypothetical protein [Nocardia cyriacigeorgica]|uniref:hypothetical protein n=1 Tax=Nocardia cyriacigeorgica TaxID=135487 RepID=UPI001893C438|nr:hypothetical protein [Nocardia cyriacigeorgica]MBF6439783.1 hypothetical protein [Nocardia cyriacigeorgica]MBF6455812.1 hypothetical protein [Nocardia cyriacigeorgica]MBF6477701.1 hypothetical protein [Nocardia cyriacigeorgica]MBF6553447.1 hypothetical protein [Nocardia cyriacigeorgica]